MRIALVLAAPPGYSETFFRNKINFLMEAGHDVTVLVDRKSGARPDLAWKVRWGMSAYSHLDRVPALVHHLLAAGPFRITRLVKMNRKSGFTWRQTASSVYQSLHLLAVSCDWLHFGFGTQAVHRENVARVLGARMAVSFRGFDIAIYPLKHPGCYSLLWSRADIIHVISDDLRQLLLKNGCDNHQQVIKITPAIDTQIFQSTVRDKSPDGPWHIATVARLHWKKGLEYTLESLALLKATGISFTYTIIGEGEEFERLVFAVDQLGLTDQVVFKGKQSQMVVRELLRGCDLYVQYSLQEGFCNAVLEAQALGLLCVVSDAEGLPENVVHDVTGWVVPKRKPDLLAEQLIRIMAMPQDQQQQVAERASARVRKDFSLEKQQAEFLRFYQ